MGESGTPATVAQAWAAVAAAEAASVYAYGAAGAHLPAGSRARARAARDDHARAQDLATGLVLAAGGTVPEPAAAYDIGAAPTTPRAARELLARVEMALAAVYAQAAGATSGGQRRQAARAGATCAMRAVGWGAAPQAFPS